MNYFDVKLGRLLNEDLYVDGGTVYDSEIRSKIELATATKDDIRIPSLGNRTFRVYKIYISDEGQDYDAEVMVNMLIADVMENEVGTIALMSDQDSTMGVLEKLAEANAVDRSELGELGTVYMSKDFDRKSESFEDLYKDWHDARRRERGPIKERPELEAKFEEAFREISGMVERFLVNPIQSDQIYQHHFTDIVDGERITEYGVPNVLRNAIEYLLSISPSGDMPRWREFELAIFPFRDIESLLHKLKYASQMLAARGQTNVPRAKYGEGIEKFKQYLDIIGNTLNDYTYSTNWELGKELAEFTDRVSDFKIDYNNRVIDQAVAHGHGPGDLPSIQDYWTALAKEFS